MSRAFTDTPYSTFHKKSGSHFATDYRLIIRPSILHLAKS